jgi:2'-5' RNA ligase
MIRKANQHVVEPVLGWRVFCAVALPDIARAGIMKHIARLREAVPEAPASWSRDQNIHLTLKFLGEIPTAKITDLSSAIARAVEGLSPFEMRLEGTGVFPNRGTPRVLWLGITDDSERLAQLQSRIENECAVEGFSKEARPFHPHFTVARLRKPHGARTLAQAHRELVFEPTEVHVSEVLVIRSELGANGSTYTIISRHSLKTRH